MIERSIPSFDPTKPIRETQNQRRSNDNFTFDRKRRALNAKTARIFQLSQCRREFNDLKGFSSFGNCCQSDLGQTRRVSNFFQAANTQLIKFGFGRSVFWLDWRCATVACLKLFTSSWQRRKLKKFFAAKTMTKTQAFLMARDRCRKRFDYRHSSFPSLSDGLVRFWSESLASATTAVSIKFLPRANDGFRWVTRKLRPRDLKRTILWVLRWFDGNQAKLQFVTSKVAANMQKSHQLHGL